jgi:3-dehydroquinate synthase
MVAMRQPLRVRLGSRSYTIAVGEGLLAEAGSLVRNALGEYARKAVIISNPVVATLYVPTVVRSLKRSGFAVTRLQIGDGERFKSLRSAERLYDSLIENRVERNDVVVAVGGGVVGDIAGFVAATYLRGIRFIQIPTSLLAQIDSSIGGKTGVNHALGKNLIGAFHQPSLVVIDPQTLSTLPDRELRAGLYEAVKYGVLGDRTLFNRIDRGLDAIKRLDTSEIDNLIRRCCSIKARIVRRDEREGGLRRVLNLGHTVGHAIEAATNYKRYLHGEAVGIGLVAESLLSERLNLLAVRDRRAIDSLVSRVGEIPNTSTLALDGIIAAMDRDKKNRAGEKTFILPVSVGQVVIRSGVPLSTVKLALRDALSSRQH